MDFIARWLVSFVMEGFVGVYELIASVSQNSFENEIVKAFLLAVQVVGLSLFAVSILVLLMKSLLAAADGNEVSIVDTLKRCIGGVVVYTYGVTIMTNLYIVILEFCSKLINVIIGLAAIEIDFIDLAFDQINIMITLIMLIIMIFYMFKTFIDLTERFWQLIVMLSMLYFYLPSFVGGDDEALVLWFKQTLAIMLTQVFQTVLITTGMTIYVSTGGIDTFFLALGAIVAASKVEQLLDRYGMGAGGKIGGVARNAMSMAFYAKSMFKGK